MPKLRKIMIWCVAVSALLIVFRVYNRITGIPKIVPPPKNEGEVIEAPTFNREGSRIGSAMVDRVGESRYKFYDPVTKKLERELGFKKLLNPGDRSKKWQLREPYMIMYNDDSVCRITSKRGTVQVETVDNNPTPTDAELYDNVVIRIQSTAAVPAPDTVIYMDRLLYNSERSVFHTNGPIKLISEKAEMEGTGLQLIYNETLNRFEFFKVEILDYLRLKNVAAFSSPRGAIAAKTSDAGSAKSTDAGEVQSVAVAGSQKPTVAVAGSQKPGEPKVVVAGDTADEKVKAAPSPDDFYECTFSRDVVIKYGDEIIVEGADEISIRNILWASGSAKSKPAEGETSADSGSAKKVTTGVPSVASVAAKETTRSASTAVASASTGPIGKEDAGSDTTPPPGDDKTAAAAEGMGVEVYITCKGSLVSKPTTSVYDSTEPPIEVMPASEGPTTETVIAAGVLERPLEGQAAGLSGGVSNEGAGEVAAGGGLQEKNALVQEEGPAVFKTRSITYDMATGSGWAQAPVELTFYPRLDKESDPNTVVLPMVITAEKNVQFLANADRVVEQVIFNKNVIGTRKEVTPLYAQTSRFFGEKMTVELNTGPKRELEGDISHIFVTEGNVKLESIRTAKERVISHVKLSCERFDYDVALKMVYATGPGRIQLNNANVPPVERQPGDKKPRLSGPCYALIRGFERLTWFTEGMQINADGKAESVYLSYRAIVDGELGDLISATTMHLQANFMPMPDGTNDLATVITTGGIYYEEEGGNVFEGQDLFYDADKSLVRVTSTEKNDCRFNGARVDWIEYAMDTGDVKAELVSSPGAIMPTRGGR
ncbi:MAG: LPS export ABC transporter periplasmic protein LptC [Planctomycetes bacterium]|nr:LPS export ABC transporter periplasmic protein LptC [Planctomycetota bacterium]